MATDHDATTDGLDFGDLDWHGSATPGRTVCITVLPRETVPFSANRRFIVKWGAASFGFLLVASALAAEDKDEVGWSLNDGVGPLWGIITNDAPLAENTLSRIVVRHNGSSSVGVAGGDIWINGSQAGTEQWFTGAITTDYNDVPQGVEIGFETDESADGMIGEYSEAALWKEEVPNHIAEALSNGMSPMFWPQNLLMYAPLWNAGFDNDVIGQVNPTINGSVGTASHPGIWYPRQTRIVHSPSAPAILLPPIDFGHRSANQPVRRAIEVVAY